MAKTPKFPSSPRATAHDVQGWLAEHGAAMTWRELVAAADAAHPRSIKQLRQLLRGMERNGEIMRDARGDYALPHGGGQYLEGILAGQGRALTVDNVAVVDAGRASLRAGDLVRYQILDGAAVVHEVITYSTAPVTGVLQWYGRYPYVEALGAVRGRISLQDADDVSQAELLRSVDHGDTVQVQLLRRGSRGLVGRLVGAVPAEGLLDQAISTALVSYDIPHEWPELVDRAVARLPKSVQAGRFPHRRDLTGLPLVTIDGETAKDFDDAVYAQALKPVRRQPRWRLVVAIADVSHYVKTGAALDVEALRRGTSVYFPERVVPMLPEALSNELCSLKPHQARLSLVCDMVITAAGEVAGAEFYEAVIHSHARLTYTQVAKYLARGGDGSQLPLREGEEQAVTASLDALQAVYVALRTARAGRGALDFETHEAVLTLEAGRVSRIDPVARSDANQLIEEAMIAANVSAGRFLAEHDTLSLYRVHEPPDQTRLDELRQALAFAGVKLPAGDVTPGALQAALEALPAHANRWVFGQLALRTMQQAVYTPDNKGHFGLALTEYMHFTSPIRRYPDLLVHRAIKAVLAKQAESGKRPQLPDADTWHWLGQQCSASERRAESAAWMVEGWLKCDYLAGFIGEPLRGTVAAVMDFGLFVELDGFFVQGLLHVSNLGSDYYQLESRSQRLVGERSGQSFAMGDQLDVVVQAVEPSQGKVDLLLQQARGGAPGKRGDRARSRRKARR